jgi:Na+/phosphate symporter
MKDEHLLLNPFRMLSPNLDHEIEHFEELHQRPVSEEITLGEGLLVMISKVIEMCRLLSESVFTGSRSQMDKCEALAHDVDQQENVLTRQLIESDLEGDLLKGLIRFPYRLERIGDMLESILNCCRIKARFGLPFSDDAYREIDELFTSLIKMMTNLRDAFILPNEVVLEAILSEGKKVSWTVEECVVAHWMRLEAGLSAVEASSMYRDILDSMKLINEYLVKMATTLGEVASHASASEGRGDKPKE